MKEKTGKRSGKEKRAGAALLGAALALGIAALAWWLLFGRGVNLRVRGDAPKDADRVSLTAVMHEAEGTCAVTQRISFRNRTGAETDHTVVRFFLNAYRNEETCPLAASDLFGEVYPDGFSPGGADLQGVRIGETPAEYEWLDGAMTALKVYTGPLRDGEECEIVLNYVLTVPECRYRWGRCGDLWILNGVFAFLAPYDGERGARRVDPATPAGNPAVSDTVIFDVTAVPEAGWQAVSSCPLEKAGEGVLKGSGFAAREAALVFYRDRTGAEKTCGDVRIRALTRRDANRTADRAAEILAAYAGVWGDCPWNTLTVLSAPGPLTETACPGLVILSEDLFGGDGDWETALARAAARQWFYGLAGCDRYRDPWQEEALCVWAALTWAEKKYGVDSRRRLEYDLVELPMRETVGESVTPGSPLDRFTSTETYETVVCGRGAAYLAALDLRLGGRLNEMLGIYVDRYAWKRASRKDFEELLREYSGEDLSEMTADYLDTLMR